MFVTKSLFHTWNLRRNAGSVVTLRYMKLIWKCYST